MFKKILIPVDLTDRHQAALQMAKDHALPEKGEVILFHVIEPIAGLGDEEVEDFYRRLLDNAQKHLEVLAKVFHEAQVPSHVKIVVGNRVQETRQYAEENEVDLIIVTAPQFDPARPEENWGSLSWKIGIVAPCPVLLAR